MVDLRVTQIKRVDVTTAQNKLSSEKLVKEQLLTLGTLGKLENASSGYNGAK
jgi:hypothetical protein